MSDVLLLMLIVVMGFVGYQMYLVTNFLRRRYMPIARNEVAAEAEGTNEPEPKKGR